MNIPALALLVVVWPHHDLQPQQMLQAQCERAAAAVTTAAKISDQQYAMEPSVSVYCIPMGTAADSVVHELLAPPVPPSKEPYPQAVHTK
jgi:hypothetical protein